MEPDAATLVLHDRRLARVPDLAMSIEGHSGVAGEKVRVDARRKVPVEQSDPDDLGLLDDQVVGQTLHVGQRAASKRVFHREPDRRARDAHAQIELRPPLAALFLDQDVCEDSDDQDHRHEEE